MFGTPLFLWAMHFDLGDVPDLRSYLFREGVIFLMAGALLLLIRYGEGLPFSSIGWHTDRPGNTALWALLGLLTSYAALAVCLVVAQFMHWKVGLQEAPKFEAPLWAVTITMFRAGITEELFYRGFALERLLSFTGSRRAAAVITVVPFALFHYRQGPAGILIAGAAGLVMTLIYLRRRSLPAVMLAHFLVDFIPNVLLPMLGMDPG
jgi:membrane protease YdiL (CAAX protease family)